MNKRGVTHHIFPFTTNPDGKIDGTIWFGLVYGIFKLQETNGYSATGLTA